MAGPVSPLFLERYELKYIIPFDLVEPISAHVATYCGMDYYSQISHDGFYIINSLYLDTPTLSILRSKDNADNEKFNLRVRSYGAEPKAPFFFEAKHKINEFVVKKRGRVFRNDWAQLLEGGLIHEAPETLNDPFVKHFVNMVMTYNAQPTILTQYRRRAYISLIDDYARVTFDRDLRYQHENTYNVIPDERRMCHYDHPDIFGDPGHNVILELKCERKIPAWFIDLIQRFNLVQSGFSKYCSAVLVSQDVADLEFLQRCPL